MTTVFRNEENIIQVGETWLEQIKESALASPRGRARLLLHHGEDDPIQEMLIVFAKDAQIRPHRTLNKSESFHVLEGRLKMIMFDDSGAVIESFEMGPAGSGSTFMTRFARGPWYTYVPLTEFVVTHEITKGPFSPDDTATPDWAPEEGPELQAFLARVSGG